MGLAALGKTGIPRVHWGSTRLADAHYSHALILEVNFVMFGVYSHRVREALNA